VFVTLLTYRAQLGLLRLSAEIPDGGFSVRLRGHALGNEPPRMPMPGKATMGGGGGVDSDRMVLPSVNPKNARNFQKEKNRVEKGDKCNQLLFRLF